MSLHPLEPHIQATHDRINQEREDLKAKYRAEFESIHAAKAESAKLDRVLDSMVGKTKRGRGRPQGSKNKPKLLLVQPEQIGYIPEDDLVIPHGR